ncbi:hypothetical protein GWE18_00380 [Bradyrhizobium sp. CSA112]|uniref:hypothetical protein n=1 Tax=Bradyrhizobium sp. CSA112 TaxID=2699170 RepID=UPI0023B08B2C|nr:hypothetical protein [Bradyrhizobium sp. CSA112]MDE5451332.1 hypothetical protein [Bradyrhizobium sp. CSA112]
MVAFVPGLTETDLKKIVLAIQQLASGRSNAVGTVTLTQNSATTVVTTATGTCFTGSVPILVPTTANAATEFGAGSLYISSIGKDTFTITHVNSATASRTFLYAIHG